VSSWSLTVRPPSIVVAGSSSVYGVEPAVVVTTGASLTELIVTLRVAKLLGAPPSSVAWKRTVRWVVSGATVSVLLYCTLRSAAW
jgi:hypothetical protein